MNAATKSEYYTIDDIYNLPDGQRAELCDKNKLTDDGCKGAPDWVVDYECNLITVYNFEHDEMTDCTFSDKVKAGIFEDFEIDFSRISIE